MPAAHGIELDSDGADLFSFRTARGSSTHVEVYVQGQYLGGFVGNVDADGTPDYQPGRLGPIDGHYLLRPKPKADYGNGEFEYLPGTPSITGENRPIGSPGESWNNTVRFHPCGGSTGCQTGPLEWTNRIWDLVAKYPDTTHLRLITVEKLEKIPRGDLLPKPHSHPWPAFNGGSRKPIP